MEEKHPRIYAFREMKNVSTSPSPEITLEIIQSAIFIAC
jgi:hypothetical protein